MSKAPHTPLPWASFGTTIVAVQNFKHLSVSARAPQEADAFFALSSVVSSSSS